MSDALGAPLYSARAITPVRVRVAVAVVALPILHLSHHMARTTRRDWIWAIVALSARYNRPCAHQYVGKYQSCMVYSDRAFGATAQSLIAEAEEKRDEAAAQLDLTKVRECPTNARI